MLVRAEAQRDWEDLANIAMALTRNNRGTSHGRQETCQRSLTATNQITAKLVVMKDRPSASGLYANRNRWSATRRSRVFFNKLVSFLLANRFRQMAVHPGGETARLIALHCVRRPGDH
jgi:hypothetical protein